MNIDARTWRINAKITLADIQQRTGISGGYLSECELGKKPASDRVIRAYEDLSQGMVTEDSFPRVAARAETKARIARAIADDYRCLLAELKTVNFIGEAIKKITSRKRHYERQALDLGSGQ